MTSSLRGRSKMAGSVGYWCFVITLCLHTFLHVTSATEVIRFDQDSSNNKRDSDDIYDILEDEQFVIADRKLSTPRSSNHYYNNKLSGHVTTARTNNEGGGGGNINTTSSSLPLSLPQKNDLSPKLTYLNNSSDKLQMAAPSVGTDRRENQHLFTTPEMPQLAGYTLHASKEVVEEEEEEDWEDGDFLLYADEKEMLAEAEEERRQREIQLAIRVKRQANQAGSGAQPLEVNLTTSYPWSDDLTNSSSEAYKNAKTAFESALQAAFSNFNVTVTVSVTGFQQGSTVVLFTVDFQTDVISTADRRELATELLAIQASGITLGAQLYTISTVPYLEIDGGTFEAANCVLCESYQVCTERGNTGEFFCQIRTSTFFRYGINQGDETLTKDRKRLSKRFKVEGGMPINGGSVNKVFVSMNGLISFGRQYRSFTPQPLPRGNRDLLCAYWADFILSSADSHSNVWYQAYVKTNSSATTQEMLRNGSAAVETHAGVTGYDPSFMLVATYEMMPPDPSDPGTPERVNFQMMVITDGYATYAMMMYAEGGMQWDASQLRRVTIGYLDTNLDIDIHSPDVVVGNTNLRGVWFFELGNVGTNPTQACLNWYYQQLPNRDRYNQLERFMPRCPCNYVVMLFDQSYFPYTLQNGVICFMLNWPIFNHAKTCCYRPPLALEQSRPLAGTFLQYHPTFNAAQSYEYDQQPKDWCCFQSNLCALYYDVRPVGTCQARWIIIIAFGRGDPHITTLDGKTFPFNAIGEFTLFKSETPTFELQGRACQAVNDQGIPVAASVFCALAVKHNNTERLHVQLSLDGNSLAVYVKMGAGVWQDVTSAYTADGNSYERRDGAMTIRRENDTLKAAFESGISLTVKVAFKLLTYELSLSKAAVNVTQVVGLMGNNDGDPDNDYIFPNGTTLPPATSERDLLEYGKTWAVTDATSLFFYDGNLTTAFYTNNSFVPIFLDEVNATNPQLVVNAQNKCGEDQGCIYDYIATQNEALALGTKDVVVSVEQNKQSANNSNPVVEGPLKIEVEMGKPVQLNFSASDGEDSDVPVYTFSAEPGNFTFDNATQTATYTPSANETAKIELSVQDSAGATSPVIQVEIIYCSGCTDGQGTCNYQELRDVGEGEQAEYFKQATCDCLPYYDGDHCENNYDACADDPCPRLTNCTDLSPAEHEAEGFNSTGYNCSNCTQGYTLNITNGDPTCYDKDECATNPCDTEAGATCSNTQGDYVCICPDTYRLNRNNKNICDDVNECTDNTHDCEQLCNNFRGGFNCSCYEGFTLDADNKTCTKDPVDPCANLSVNCEYGCRNDSGVAQCFCAQGYTLGNDTHCINVNECNQNICSQKCTDSDGSFTCSCYSGYTLGPDKITCNPCPANMYGDYCNITCECRGRGSCDSVRGCVCNEGWTGTSCNTNVNECNTLTKPCEDTHVCVDTQGSYLCNCPPGYRKVNDSLCVDIDECATPNLNTCPQVCSNTIGSYVCSCIAGYNYNAATNQCDDIDECALGISQCEQKCDNYPGLATCTCEAGFLLNDDRKTCRKELDPCQALAQTKNCSFICVVNGAGDAECRCPIGYKLAADDVSCIDIKECDSNATNDCSAVGGQCVEEPGSYSCTCSPGYKLENDQRTCTECDAYHWGDNCATECNCHPLNTLTCDKVVGCQCKDGWLGTFCDQDRDDCQSNPCQNLEVCTDVAGSYNCDCQNGYGRATENASCTDVDECDNNPCDQTCNNTVGSYTCSCSDGFFLSDGNKCNDIDECLNSPCDQLCRNTEGGYFCECNPGFLLNTTTRKTCYPESECTASNCDQDCYRNASGTEVCTCRNGYTVNATDDSRCDDINECAASTNPCKGGGSCSDTPPGGFTCTCSPGTYLLGDGVTCQECPSTKYGTDCANTCTCDTDNSLSCNAVNGTCTCKEGWKGANCTEDIDECPAGCANVANSDCVNTIGSFSCRCHDGFSQSNGQCLPCDDIHYGTECRDTCACERANTADCNDITGVCTCKPGWTGSNCTDDVNECAVANASNPCLLDVHETCRNIAGGYSCDCVSGYERTSASENCTDIKECLDPDLNTCDTQRERCVEEEGKFSCVCASGYTGTPGSCSATYRNFTFTITLQWNPSPAISDDLRDRVEASLTATFRRHAGASFHAVVVIRLTAGSLLVESVLQIDDNKTSNAEADAARAIENFLEEGQLDVDSTSRPVGNIQVGNVTLTKTENVCDAYLALTSCGTEEVCRAGTDGLPVCSPLEDDSDNDLIIGLGVGIPLLFIVAIVVGAIIYMCVKRKSSGSTDDDPRAEASEHRFPSIFAGQIAPKGSWGAAQRYHMYSPDNVSVSHASDSSGEGQLLKQGRRLGRSDFQDSAWYESRGGPSGGAGPGPSALSSPRRTDDGAREEAATSNFSWEYMFRLLQPYKGGLEIQRPRVEPVANPAYTPRSRGPRPDSLA